MHTTNGTSHYKGKAVKTKAAQPSNRCSIDTLPVPPKSVVSALMFRESDKLYCEASKLYSRAFALVEAADAIRQRANDSK